MLACSSEARPYNQNYDLVQTVPLDQLSARPLFTITAVNPESQPLPPQMRSESGAVIRAVAKDPTSLTANKIEPS